MSHVVQEVEETVEERNTCKERALDDVEMKIIRCEYDLWAHSFIHLSPGSQQLQDDKRPRSPGQFSGISRSLEFQMSEGSEKKEKIK